MKLTGTRGGLVIGTLLAIAGSGLALSTTEGSVLFSSNFDSGVLSDAATQSTSQGWKRAGTMPVLTQELAKGGKFSMKAYLNKNTSPTPYRTMSQSDWDTTTDVLNRVSPNVPFFEDSWVGFSIYLPSKGPGNWSQASDTYEILAQWHDTHKFPTPSWDTEESKNPVFALAVTDTPHSPARHWRVSFLGEGRTPYPVIGSPRPWRYESSQGFDLGSIDPDLDKWTDFVVRIRWNYWKVGTSNNTTPGDALVRDNIAGTATAGLIQVWKNGKLVVDKGPVQIGTHDNNSPMFSVGLYKGWRTQADRDGDPVVDRVMYFDSFRYAGKGGRYEDVAPTPGGTTSTEPVAPAPRKPASPRGFRIE